MVPFGVVTLMCVYGALLGGCAGGDSSVTQSAGAALPPATILRGVIIGSSLMIGAFVGKLVILRTSSTVFQHLLDALMLCSGISLLLAAFTT